MRPDPNTAAHISGAQMSMWERDCHDWGASLAKDVAWPTLLSRQVTAGLALLLIHSGKLSSAKKQGHSKPALKFWRKESKPGYEFLEAEDYQTFIKATLKFSVTSTSACIIRIFFSKSTVVCFYLHFPLMSLPRGLEMLLSSITTKAYQDLLHP